MQTVDKKLTAEQRRASHAWSKAVEGVAKHQANYVNDAKGLPALIMNSGLMQVTAFLYGKGGRHAMLGGHLLDWLHIKMNTPQNFEKFMQHLAELEDARQFQAITTEAMAWLKWLRQLAPAANEGRGE